MTIIPPTLPPLSGFPSNGGPFTNVTPYTYRSGETLIDYIELLRRYIADHIAPHIDAVRDELVEEFLLHVTELTNNVNDAIAEHNAEINAYITVLNGLVQDVRELEEEASGSAAAALSSAANALTSANNAAASATSATNTVTAFTNNYVWFTMANAVPDLTAGKRRFSRSLTSNEILNVPLTGRVDGDMFVIRYRASGANRTLTFGANMIFSADFTQLPIILSGDSLLLTFIFDSVKNKWVAISYAYGV